METNPPPCLGEKKKTTSKKNPDWSKPNQKKNPMTFSYFKNCVLYTVRVLLCLFIEPFVSRKSKPPKKSLPEFENSRKIYWAKF